MSPTSHLRFVWRNEFFPDCLLPSKVRILQQLWREHHIPAGETEPKEEWRDVAVVEQT